MNFYMRYMGDYMRDTTALNLMEHGAYTVLLDLHYSTENPIQKDPDLYRILRCKSKKERDSIDKILSIYFTETNDGWVNNRAQEDIVKHCNRRESSIENGKKGGRPKNPVGSSQGTQNGTQNNPLHNHNHNHNQKETLKHIPSTQKSKAAPKVKNYVFSDQHMSIATQLSCPVKLNHPKIKINLEEWADCVRIHLEKDRREVDELTTLWQWITDKDRGGWPWWKNCRTPMKLRLRKDGLQYFDICQEQMLGDLTNGNRSGTNSSQPRKKSLIERVEDNCRRSAEDREQGTGQTFDGEFVAETDESIRP